MEAAPPQQALGAAKEQRLEAALPVAVLAPASRAVVEVKLAVAQVLPLELLGAEPSRPMWGNAAECARE